MTVGYKNIFHLIIKKPEDKMSAGVLQDAI